MFFTPDSRTVNIAASQHLREKEFWLKTLAGTLTRSRLPFDFQRPASPGGPAAETFTIEGRDSARIQRIGNHDEKIIHMVLTAGLVLLIHKYTGNEDILTGTAIYEQGEPSRLINTVLPLRIGLRGDSTFKELLLQVRQRIEDAVRNQNYPVRVLARQLQLSACGDDVPLFEIALLVDNIHDRRYLRPVPLNILFRFECQPAGMTGLIEYDAGRYAPATIQRLGRHYCFLLRQVLDDVGIGVGQLDMLSEPEKERVLLEFNDTGSAYPRDSGIHELFQAQADEIPGKIAVAYDDEALTYGALKEEADRLANFLYFEKRVRTDDLVGILLDKSVYLIIALLGVLKAGGAYVPINPGFPEERMKDIIDDSACGIVVSQKRYVKMLNRLQWECRDFRAYICLDSRDVHREPESRKNELMDRKLWEYVGETAADEIAAGGWTSSYTGQPFSRAEMDEYGDNILEKLKPHLHRGMRVLEIGCASGISMYRIAPRVGLYYGTDLSGVIIDRNRQRIRREGTDNIELACLPAHEISRIAEDNFDLVILNSVIQCFHGHNYLRQVIAAVIELMAPQGLIMIGDIMDQDRKSAFLEDLERFKRQQGQRKIKTKTDWTAELFVSRGFFEDLAVDRPEIRELEFSEKIHRRENELTRFRFDLLMRIDRNKGGTGRKASRHKYQYDMRAVDRWWGRSFHSPAGSGRLAYVNYTSGTTGKAKGVLVENRSVVRLVRGADYIDFHEDYRMLQTGAIEFDASTFEIWGALLNSMSLFLAGRDSILSHRELLQLVTRRRIDIMWLTSALFNRLVEVDIDVFARLKFLLVGGDVLSPVHIRQVRSKFPALKIINGYGPTENTTFSTTHRIGRVDDDDIPIGRPIANSMAYILDSHDYPAAPGAWGELCVGGDGLSRGYLNNPELSAEKFAHSPHFPCRRLYRTGDRCRWRDNGIIEFGGRTDQQVKVRGFRVELAEIERYLVQHENIDGTAVAVGEDEWSDKYLVAYVVAGHGDDNSGDLLKELRAYLAGRLPEYMIPAHFVKLASLPLTENGKVDRKSLPPPVTRLPESSVPPRDTVENKIADLWSDILGIERTLIGIDQNFFEIGGHSLKATILASRIHKELAVKVPLAEFFKNQTIMELADYIRGTDQERFQDIGRVELRGHYPSSSAQKRLFFLQRMFPRSVIYNMPAAFELEGNLSLARLEAAIGRLIRRHEGFRTSFRLIRDEPVQVVHPTVRFDLDDRECPGGGADETRGWLEEFVRPFDLHCAPLLRAGVIEIDLVRHILLIDMHHIISDGTSLSLLVKEFISFYSDDSLPELMLTYKDYAAWQARMLEGRDTHLERQAAYWRHQFPGDVPQLTLPGDYERPEALSFAGDKIKFELGMETAGALRALASARQASPFMALLSIFTVLLSRLSGREDLVTGTPVAGRRHADLHHLVGNFVNTLPLRTFPSPGKPFGDFLQEVKQGTLAAFENQDYPFEELVKRVAVHRDHSRNPLFDVMFAFQNMELPELELPDLRLKPLDIGSDLCKFDLTFTVFEKRGTFYFSLSFSTDLFRRDTMHRWVGYFLRLTQSACREPARRIAALEMMTEAEKQEILYGFNRTGRQYPAGQTLHRLFEKAAGRWTHHSALVFRDRQVTYGSLDSSASALARTLRSRGVCTDTVVGVLTERTPLMVTALLGILKAGGAYLPIDPGFPGERVRFMLNDSGALLVVADGESRNKSSMNGRAETVAVAIDGAGAVIRDSDGNRDAGASGSHSRSGPSHLAYVIYTSGSTGRPKGVLVEHRHVLNVINWFGKTYGLGPGIHVLQLTDYTFDASVNQIFSSLVRGAALYLAPRELIGHGDRFYRFVRQRRIHIINFVPLILDVLIDWGHKPDCIRAVICGGERLPDSRKDRILEMGYALYNQYGPSETTIDALMEVCSALPVSLGKPIDNMRCYILGADHTLQPVGIVGELYIGGAGVCRGYLNRPELACERFVTLSVAGSPPQPLYRTGDLARWRPDGSIQFLGRADRQVKIRGYRIELAEIENRLQSLPGLKEAVVVLTEENREERGLAAYFTCDGSGSNSGDGSATLPDHLSRSLPDYMIPALFIQLESMPRTVSGKIDRARLPKPGRWGRGKGAGPRDEIEARLIRIWRDILSLNDSPVGIDSHFFELGGHSLKATVMLARIQREFNVEIPLSRLFAVPTVRGLADYLRAAGEQGVSYVRIAEEREYYPLSAAQKRLYILHRLDPDGLNYNMPSVFDVEGDIDIHGFNEVVNRLVDRHHSLRTSFRLLEGGVPVQIIHEPVACDIEYSRGDGEEQEVETRLHSFFRPFDLAVPPLWRVGLHRIAGRRHILMVDMHHIIADGTSLEILVKDLLSLYRGIEPAESKYQYKDYALWRLSPEYQQLTGSQKRYWLDAFGDEIPVLHLPNDYARPLTRSFAGSTVRFEMEAEAVRPLRDLALRHQATLFMVVLTLFYLLLSRLSGQEDIVVGSPTMGRRQADWQPLIGMFVNILALRSYPSAGKRFGEFLGEVKRTTLLALENQDYQFEDLVEVAGLRRDTGRNPLFDVMFNLLDREGGTLEIPGLNLRPFGYSSGTAKFDLSLVAAQSAGRLAFTFEYSTRLFKRATVERFAAGFRELLSRLPAAENRRLGDIEMITPAERRRILSVFNRPAAPYPRDTALHHWLEEQAGAAPDRCALYAGDRQVSCRVLNGNSDRLALRLRTEGATVNEIIAIVAERSIEAVTGIMGILKSGGAYMPIDPGTPPARLNYILAESGAGYWLTTVATRAFFNPDFDGNDGESNSVSPVGININEVLSSPAPVTAPAPAGTGRLAYVIYTSGSTGTPRGVMLEHRGVANVLRQMQALCPLLEDDAYLFKTNYTFDVSVTEIFGWSLGGGRLAILAEGDEKVPLSILESIIRHRVSHLNFVPSMLQLFLQAVIHGSRRGDPEIPAAGCVKYVMVAGEAFPETLVQDIRNSGLPARFLNIYGPTEAAVYSTRFILPGEESEDPGPVPIGRPIGNVRCIVADPQESRRLSPPGVAGELCIGGEGVARGYLNRPETTARRFVQRSFAGSERWYRSGDLCRWLPDGNLEFLRRMDHQVKIRGFRIELEEIETQLRRHPLVGEAVVVIRQDELSDHYLAAFVVPRSSRTAAGNRENPAVWSSYRDFLSERLPHFMIPAAFVEIEALPLTRSGKVDRQALPEVSGGGAAGGRRPSTELEKAIAKIWSRVLAIDYDNLGLDSRFFEIGGNSLKAIRIAARLRKDLNIDVSLNTLFNLTTIGELAGFIRKRAAAEPAEIRPVEEREYYEVSYHQQRIWHLDQAAPGSGAFNLSDWVVLKPPVDIPVIERVVREIVKRHESLRTFFRVVDSRPVQSVQRWIDIDEIPFRVVDISGLSPRERDRQGEKLRRDVSAAPFSLDSGQFLFRVWLVKWGCRHGELLVTMHHIISDGRSLEILRREFTRLHGVFLGGEGIRPAPPGIHYKEFAAWHRRLLADRPATAGAVGFWKSLLEKDIPPLDLPYDYPGRASSHRRSAAYRAVVGDGVTRRLRRLSVDRSASLYMLLLSGFYLLLHQVTGQSDIVIGAPGAGRRHEDFKEIMGFFVNTLVLRNSIRPEDTFTALLDRVKANLLQVLEYQDYPLELICSRLKVKYPGISVFFNMLDFGNIDQNVPAPAGDRHVDTVQETKFELVIYLTEYKNGIDIDTRYFKSRFSPSTVESLIKRYLSILEGVSRDPWLRIGRYSSPKKRIRVKHIRGSR